MSRATRFHFHEFTYDVGTGELTSVRENVREAVRETVRLQPQPAAALRVLVEHAGQLVTRDTLKQAIWPDTVVEADQGLNFCIRQIRQALGEDADGARFIETLPRRGYRFVAPLRAAVADAPTADALTADVRASNAPPDAGATAVRSTNTGIDVAAVTPVESEVAAADVREADARAADAPDATPGDGGAVARRSGLARAAFASVLVALLVALLAASALYVRGKLLASAAIIAVLPLNSANDDEWMRMQNAAFTEALVTALTNSPTAKFGVIGPATTARFAGTKRAHTEIGAELGADYVVSGGLRTVDSLMFIQAIRVSDGVHIFALRRPLAGGNTDSVAALMASGIAAKLK